MCAMCIAIIIIANAGVIFLDAKVRAISTYPIKLENECPLSTAIIIETLPVIINNIKPLHPTRAPLRLRMLILANKMRSIISFFLLLALLM